MEQRKVNTMTVGQLKKYLERFDENAKVGFLYPAGDYWHTEVLGTINGSETVSVEWSEYHGKYGRVDETNHCLDNGSAEEL